MPQKLRFGIPSFDTLFSAFGPPSKEVDVNAHGIQLPSRDAASSICLIGPDGTGKSVFALHLASRYLADCVAKKEKLPLVLYVSTDLTFEVAEKMWENFALDRPNKPKDPFHPKPADDESQIIKPILCEIDKTHEMLAEPPSSRVLFVDIASTTAGDDWGFLHRLLSVLEKSEANAPRHLVIIDAVEGFDLGGELNAFGESASRRSRIAQVMRLVNKKCHAVFVVEEAKANERHPEQFVTDVVVRMRKTEEKGFSRRTIEIEKARGQAYARGPHHYAIRSGRGATTGEQDHYDDPIWPLADGKSPCSYVYVFQSLHHFNRSIMERRGQAKPEFPQDQYTAFGIPYLDNMLAGDNEDELRDFSRFGENGFLSTDFKDAAGLIKKLKAKGNAFITYILNQYLPSTGKINSYHQGGDVSEDLLKELAETFTKLLDDNDLLEQAKLGEIALSARTRNFGAQFPLGESRQHFLNRTILEDAFPDEIERKHNFYDRRGLPVGTVTALVGDSLTQKSRLGYSFLSRCFTSAAASIVEVTRNINPSSLRFSAVDFKDLTKLTETLAEQVAQKDPLAKYLHKNLTVETKQLKGADSSNKKKLQNAWIAGFNKSLKGPSLYNKLRRRNITLSDEIEELQKLKPSGEELVRLNCLLLEAAYSGEISSHQIAFDTLADKAFTLWQGKKKAEANAKELEQLQKEWEEKIEELQQKWEGIIRKWRDGDKWGKTVRDSLPKFEASDFTEQTTKESLTVAIKAKTVVWLLGNMDGVAVMLTTLDTHHKSLATNFMSLLLDDKGLQKRIGEAKLLKDAKADNRFSPDNLDPVYVESLRRYIEAHTICRRLEIHDIAASIIIHIFDRTIEAAQKLISQDLEKNSRDAFAESHRIRIVLDDFSTMVNTYSEMKDELLLLPSLMFLLGRSGASTLVIDTQTGDPNIAIAERFDSELRELVQNRLYTWRVPFYGENRVALTVIPPISPEYAGIVRELKWESKKRSDPLIVDPHFELYSGLEDGKPASVPLEIRLYAELPWFKEYVEKENTPFKDLFKYADSAEGKDVIIGYQATQYDDLRDSAYLQRDTRLDHTLIYHVDEFWGVRLPDRRRAGAFRNQWPYLSAITRRGGEPDKDVDPYTLFQLKERDLLLFTVDDFRNAPDLVTKLKTSENDSVSKFIYGQLDKTLKGLLNDYSDGQKMVGWTLANALMEGFNALLQGGQSLYDKSEFKEAALEGEAKQLSEREKTPLTEIEVVRFNRLLLEAAYPKDIAKSQKEVRRYKTYHTNPGYNWGLQKNETNDERRIDRVPFSWDFGFMLCKQSAWQSARTHTLTYMGNVNSNQNVGEVFDALTKTTPLKIASAIPRQPLLPYTETIFGEAPNTVCWRDFLEACYQVSLNQSVKESKLVPALDFSQLSPESFSCLMLEIWASEIYKSLATKDEQRAFAASLHQHTWLDSGKESLIDWIDKYRFQLYLSWVLLLDVLDFSRIATPGEIESFNMKPRFADKSAVAARHWYKTASCWVEDNSPENAVVAVRLPGHFSVRGDWFLAVAGGSRSSRLADRALDLLSSRRANLVRMQEGLGLPVRKLFDGTNPPNKLRTRLICPDANNYPDCVEYTDLLKISAVQEPPDFRWLWRSNLRDYHRESRIWHKWLKRMCSWWINKRQRNDDVWKSGFFIYDHLTEENKTWHKEQWKKIQAGVKRYGSKPCGIMQEFDGVCDFLKRELEAARSNDSQ